MNAPLKIFLIVFITIISSCYKDNIIVDNTDIIGKKYPKIAVNAEIVGILHDEDGNEITGYAGTFLNEVYSATNSPFYHFSAVDANKNGSLLEVEYKQKKYQFLVKPIGDDINYFSHSIIANPEQIEKTANLDIDANLSNNITLKIAGNSYLMDGNQYEGDVIINTFVPDLSKPFHLESIPGGHMAIDSDSNNVWLDYHSVVYLGVEAGDNSPLAIIKGKANLAIDNPDCDDCSAWYYDSKKHIWEAQKWEDNSKGKEFGITKSGFYALAKPYVFNLVEGNVEVDERPLINQAIDILFQDRLVDRVYTTNKGQWFTHLPINQAFKYKVDIDCNEAFAKNFSIEEKDVKINSMELTKTSVPVIDISGVVRNCSNEKINQNFLKVLQGDEVKTYFFDSPEISLKIPYCSEKILRIQSADNYWEDIGPQLDYIVSSGTVNIKSLYSCNQILQDGYFSINIDGKEKLFNITESKLQGGRTELLVYDSENIDFEFSLKFSGQEVRKYQDNELNMYFKNLNIDWTIYNFNCSSSTTGCGFENFEISSYGNKKGDWLKGSFEGEFWIKTYNPLKVEYKTIKGDFLVKRNFK